MILFNPITNEYIESTELTDEYTKVDTPPFEYWKVVDGILVDVTDSINSETSYCKIELI
jgi:hypothetical protein